MKTCHTCLANAVCDHNRFGFETCGNYIAKDVVSREDYDRRGRIIDSYALQYGTARDKYKVIIRIKREGAAEVLDEIAKRERKALPEACPVYVLTQDELDALRKKYTEGCDT